MKFVRLRATIPPGAASLMDGVQQLSLKGDIMATNPKTYFHDPLGFGDLPAIN